MLLVLGGLHEGLAGLIGVDLVGATFGATSTLARALQVLVGVAALWTIRLLAKRWR